MVKDMLAGRLSIRRDGRHMIARIELEDGRIGVKYLEILEPDMDEFFASAAAADLVNAILKGTIEWP